jgi:dipeptidyl aminopeptidase/acylaminoacyl peptidase
LAYIRMPDSNIPFTVGELWVADGNAGNAVLLGAADAGHGYEPAWSPDGAKIAFVGRENKDDVAADQVADRLVSNIYMADVKSRKVDNLSRFGGALVENPTWSPDGAALAFSTNAGGQGMDMWTFDAKGNQLAQVTHSANARYPSWLKNLGSMVNQPANTPLTLTQEATETRPLTPEIPSLVPSETVTATDILSPTPNVSTTATLALTTEQPTLSATMVLTGASAVSLTATPIPIPAEAQNPITNTVTLTH